MKVKFKKWDCVTRIGWYGNGNLGIELIDEEDGGVVAKATTNTGKVLPDNQVAIKDWTENMGMVEALEEAGVIDKCVGSEWVNLMAGLFAPIYTITEEFKKEVEKAEGEN